MNPVLVADSNSREKQLKNYFIPDKKKLSYCIFLSWSSILYVKKNARYHGLISDVKICREGISVVPQCQHIEECPIGEKER